MRDATLPTNLNHHAAGAHPVTRGGRKYLNVILTANALLLGVLALNGLGHSFTSVSQAQGQPRANDADDGGRISAAEQRKTMIAQLTTLTHKMERLEALVSRGLNVRVVEMPAGFSAPRADDKGRTEKKTESKSEVKASKGADADQK